MPRIYLWQKAPSIRLLVALMIGIVIQWYFQLPLSLSYVFAAISICFIIIYRLFSLSKKYQYSWINGIGLIMLLFSLGFFLTYSNNIKNNKNWFGNIYKDGDLLVVTLQEPLVSKSASFKADASVDYIKKGDQLVPVKGNIIIYFKKDSGFSYLGYGSELVIKTSLQEIKNGGNPGGFDYKRYAQFQAITYQVYLNNEGFEPTGKINEQWLDAFLVKSRKAILNILRKYITSPKEQGLAEALLIGYKNDLDKTLIESYSKTGVVHVIAISGLHLGIIYAILMWLTKPLKRKKLPIIRLAIILVFLWLFSLLAGAQPSVLRSAIMFSCISIGSVIYRKSSIYNTIAISALSLLLINPFWLWDVGFQLSYAAVISIVIFYRPIYKLWPFNNSILDAIWKLIAVSTAAQILTLPISIYHFHQFPIIFIITNLIAVPLSSLILIGEILLCAISFVTPLAQLLGKALEVLIRWMNSFIEYIEKESFAVWDGLSITVLQTIILYLFIASFTYYLLEKNKKAFVFSVSFILIFFVLRTVSFLDASNQKKVIVYNVPKHQAIDLINGRNYSFVGDKILLQDDFLRNFHLKPSRIVHRISPDNKTPKSKSFQFYSQRILIIDTDLQFEKREVNEKLDLIILSKNPRLYISNLNNAFAINQIVIDGSVPSWKSKLWKKDCDSLKIRYHDVTEKGAFVMNL